MRERTIGTILGMLNLLLLALCLVLYLGKDRSTPELTLQAVEFVYEEDLPEHILLSGVTARDNKDGDLTDHVVIEKIVTSRSQKTATITYGVSDEAGNVKRAARTLVMPVLEKPQLPTAGEAGSMEETSSGEAEVAEVVEEATTETTMEAESTQAESESETTTENAETQNTDGRPGIVFTSREIRVKAGETPVWESVIGEVTDDKDTRESLLGTLAVKGEYDLQKAGEYYLTLSVTDSDGNASNDYPMKLIVEE